MKASFTVGHGSSCCFCWIALLLLILTGCGGWGGGEDREARDGAINTYSVGGVVTGLAPGQSLRLENGADSIILSSNGSFAFPSVLTNGDSYSVTIVNKPANQPCTTLYGMGIILYSDVTNINVFCGPLPENAWHAASNLITARVGYTATLLPNGKVLVAGGLGVGGFLSNAELYDPTTNAWSPARSLSQGRIDHTATLLPNGRVLVSGGVGGWGALSFPLSNAEIYDPITDTWMSGGALPNPESNDISYVDHAATLLLSGSVLISGGGGGYITAIYDPALNLWTSASDTSSSRRAHSATLLTNGRVLVAGGMTAGASTEIYDPATGNWSPAGSLILGRFHHTATLLPDNGLLVAGGSNGILPIASAEIYDWASNMWAAAGGLTVARTGHTATLLPTGKVLVVGGDGDTLTTADIFDPATRIWSVAASPSTGFFYHTATLLQNGKLLLISSGWSSDYKPMSSAELYW